MLEIFDPEVKVSNPPVCSRSCGCYRPATLIKGVDLDLAAHNSEENLGEGVYSK